MNAPPEGGASTVDVEAIVPVHDLARPLGRTVRSILSGGLAPDALRVTLVAHNISAAAVLTLLDEQGIAGELTRGTVRVLELHDGGRSPAGPRSLGLESAAARFVCFVDSDDWLQPGALAAWLQLADRRRADAIIALERHANGSLVRNPPVRVMRRGPLVAGPDRLVYRTALRGLFSLDAVRAEHLAFTSGGTNGSDQPFTLRLWHSGRPMELASRLPTYVLGDDAPSRVTRTLQPLDVELAAPRALLHEPWFARLAQRDRAQAATKIVRIHVLPQLATRLGAGTGAVAALETARGVLAECDRAAPSWERSLSRIDRRIVDLVRTDAPTSSLVDLLAVRRRFGHPRALLTRRLVDALRRDAPLRLATAAALLSLRASPVSAKPLARP